MYNNGSWEEGDSTEAVGQVHSRCFYVIGQCTRDYLAGKIDGAAQHKEEGELGHCLTVLSVFCDNFLLNVAEADNGYSNADSHWYEASSSGPDGSEGVTSFNEDNIVDIWEAGHTIDKLCFKHLRKQNKEDCKVWNKPEDGNDDCSIVQADGLLPISHNCQDRK